MFRCFLLLFNIVDAICGGILICYSVWLKVALEASDTAVSIYWILPLSIGVTLMVMSTLSFLGMACSSCRVLLSVSSWLAFPVSLLELAISTSCYFMQDAFFEFLNDNKSEMNMSDKTVDSIHVWFIVIIAMIFILGCLQIFRFYMSKNLRNNIRKDAREFDDYWRKDTDDYRRRQDESRVQTKEKYDALRQKYKDKYSRSGSINQSSLMTESFLDGDEETGEAQFL
uniref:Uncharacterized protein n=1 Tax=Octactis speculum TaxID=3111310 RepID=A0A7S2G6L6_9STRA